jgi:hypothetical protein
MIIALLMLVFADPGRKMACCRPAVAPLVGGTALWALIFLYAGTHTLYYASLLAASAPLASGAALALVAAGFLFLPHLAHGLLRGLRRRLLLWLIAREESCPLCRSAGALAPQTPRSTPQPVPRLVPVQAQG